MTKEIKVTQSAEGPEVSAEIIADAIVAISTGIKKLRSGRLNDRALLLLIAEASPTIRSPRKAPKPISMKQVQMVLDGIASLETTFLKKKPAK